MTVGILTSGGDCQALNAAMRGVAKSLYEKKNICRDVNFDFIYIIYIWLKFMITILPSKYSKKPF